MKKQLLVIILFLILFFASTTGIAAQNKCGINIGPKYDQVNQVISLVKTGGWIVTLGTPGNCSNFESLFGKGLNVVIRAYNGGKPFTNEQALGWVATLGKLNTQGQVVYFMPWNEPDHNLECGNRTCSVTEVANYVSYLKQKLSEAGLLDTKVILLSPMIDKLGPRFEEFKSIYSFTNGSSINEYDQFPGPCSAGGPQNNCLYDQIGIPAPYYALEAGVAGTSVPPWYKDSELRQMLDKSWSKWSGDGNFKMFAIFSYDPHPSGHPFWNIFSAPQVRDFYSNNCQAGGITTGNANQAQFDSWFNTNSGSLVSCGGCGYAPNQDFCAGAGGPGTEPDTLFLQDSYVCTDFEIKYYTESPETETITMTPTPAPTDIPLPTPTIPCIFQEGGCVLGVSSRGERGVSFDLGLSSENVPDFSQLSADSDTAITMLLPEELRQRYAVDETPLKGKAKNYVYGKDSAGNLKPADVPSENDITLPNWWTGLLGRTKILCGLFGTCSAPKNVAIKIQPATATSLSPDIICYQSEKQPEQPVGVEATQGKKSITTSSWFSKTISEWSAWIEDTVNHLLGRTRNITEDSSFANKTRQNLPGGKTFGEETSTYADTFIPAQIAPNNKNAALGSNVGFNIPDSNYKIQEKPDGSEKIINYQNLKAAQLRRCLQLGAVYPESFNVEEIDPLCKSRDYKDFNLNK